MDEAERQSKRGSPGPATYYPKVRLNIMQQENRKDAHQRVLNVLKVITQGNKFEAWACRGLERHTKLTTYSAFELVLHLSRRLRTFQPTN
jgi:hypothetical protein